MDLRQKKESTWFARNCFKNIREKNTHLVLQKYCGLKQTNKTSELLEKEGKQAIFFSLQLMSDLKIHNKGGKEYRKSIIAFYLTECILDFIFDSALIKKLGRFLTITDPFTAESKKC